MAMMISSAMTGGLREGVDILGKHGLDYLVKIASLGQGPKR